MIEPRDITGVVLCGGEGARFAGRDKPLELLRGEPLVAHVSARLASRVARVMISCNRNAAEYRRWGEVVPDEARGCGPLAGIAAALDRLPTPWAFVCPGDAPMLEPVLIERLAQARGADDHDPRAMLRVAHDGVRRQPLFMLVHRDRRVSLRAHLARGDRSARGWLDEEPHLTVRADDLRESFVNVNSADDLERLAAKLARERVA